MQPLLAQGAVPGPLRVDTLTAAALFPAALVFVSVQERLPDMRPLDLAGVLLMVGVCAPVCARRRYPLCALGAVLAVGGVYAGAGYPASFIPPLFYLMAYSVAAWDTRPRAIAGLGLVIAVMVGLLAADVPNYDDGGAVIASMLAVLFWLAGHALRWRREATENEMRAARESAEIERQQAARAVAEERLRIAQDLHDLMTHSMSVVAVQAGMGCHLLATDPERAGAALSAISDISRSTLAELRQLLGVLRAEDGGKETRPAPSIDDLAVLVADVRAAGTPVTLRIDGERSLRNPGIELSAYRVVQEALTNVMKHAGATSAVDVVVRYQPDELAVEVSDDGRGMASSPGPAPGGGHGLMGMRERVAVWGGRLDAGPRSGGGFKVQATFPHSELA